MQSVSVAQFLNITFLLILFGASAVPLFGIVKVPVTRMYSLLYSYKLDLVIKFLNLMSLLVLYAPHDSPFV